MLSKTRQARGRGLQRHRKGSGSSRRAPQRGYVERENYELNYGLTVDQILAYATGNPINVRGDCQEVNKPCSIRENGLVGGEVGLFCLAFI